MLVRTVSQYLESHKRLVIPQLGTFIVKEPGVSVVFSELLKRDDGVLRQLLCSAGMGELEAAGEIDRFVFEVRHAIERGGEFTLAGFGVLQPGPNGTIVFAYEPLPARSAPAGSAPEASEIAAAPTSAAPVAAATESQAAEIPETAPTSAPAAVPHSDDRPISPSAKMNPDPSVRGLRYGRPPKNTNAYTYVDRPRRRGADRFVWIALLAAAIALAAIGFGYFCNVQDPQEPIHYIDPPVEQVLLPTDEPE